MMKIEHGDVSAMLGDSRLVEASWVVDGDRSLALAVWLLMIESFGSPLGYFTAWPGSVAIALGRDPAKIERLFAAFERAGLTRTGWVSTKPKKVRAIEIGGASPDALRNGSPT